MHSTMGAQLDECLLDAQLNGFMHLRVCTSSVGKITGDMKLSMLPCYGLPRALGSEIERLHGVILDLWVNILSWRVILQIFSNLACERSISDPRAVSSPYHGHAYHDHRLARAVVPLE